MSEQQWTQLAAELKAAETAPKMFDELCNRIKQLTTANEESEVPTVKESDETETYNESETEQAETNSAKF